MNSLQNSISITTGALLAEKPVSFLALAQLVLRQETVFSSQNISVSLRKRVLQ
jgi:hypothetical protein